MDSFIYFYLFFVVILLPLSIAAAGYYLLKRKRIKIFEHNRCDLGRRGKGFLLSDYFQSKISGSRDGFKKIRNSLRMVTVTFLVPNVCSVTPVPICLTLFDFYLHVYVSHILIGGLCLIITMRLWRQSIVWCYLLTLHRIPQLLLNLCAILKETR